MRGGIACESSGQWAHCYLLVAQPEPASQAARLSETAIAFARSCSCGIETHVAFAGGGRASNETVVAFAGKKWAFLVQFSGAEVTAVSAVPCWGRAVVMVVSCWPASAVAEVLLVSTSPRGCVLCAKKFALYAQNTPKSAFLRVLGEFFRGRAAGGAVLGELFLGLAAVGHAERVLLRRGLGS